MSAIGSPVRQLFVIFVSVFNDLILISICHAVKAPFLKYQLVLGVMQHRAESKIKPYLYIEHLLTAEGLGVPDRTFSNLEVTVSLFSH
jgi:aminoglycoside/choline kinase family phosphotransferase